MTICAGIDVGSAAAKAVVVSVEGGGARVIAHGLLKIRKLFAEHVLAPR